jgi:hypothetical protein
MSISGITISRVFSNIRNLFGRNRKIIEDVSLVILLLIVALLVAYEFDIYTNMDGVRRQDKTIELDEALTICGLFGVGLIFFSAQKRELQRRVEEATKRAEQETAHVAEVSACGFRSEWGTDSRSSGARFRFVWGT